MALDDGGYIYDNPAPDIKPQLKREREPPLQRRRSSFSKPNSYSAWYTNRPPTIVATTFPVSCQPSNGVLRDLERVFAASKVQRFLGSKMVTSA